MRGPAGLQSTKRRRIPQRAPAWNPRLNRPVAASIIMTPLAEVCMAAICALMGVILGQDPQEVERLRKEIEDLRERVAQLQAQAAEDAAIILRLRQALKALESNPPAPAAAAAPEAADGAASNPRGPKHVIRGRVRFVNPQIGFILVNVGEKHGVQQGHRFEILREEQAPGGGPGRIARIGVAEFEKFMGDDRDMSKLKMVEGNAADVRIEDEVVAYRDVESPLPSPPKAPEPPKPGVYKITGRAGSGYVTNYGSAEGARQSQILMVYKDGKLKAKLRLDTVERTYSVGNVIDGTQVFPIEEDDQVYTTELRKTAIGKVRVADEKRGAIMVDVGQNNFGVKAGDRLEVRRHGQKIGMLRVYFADKFWSWAKPEGVLQVKDVQTDDTVEIVAEK